MVFELVRKGLRKPSLEENEVSISSSMIGIGNALSKSFEKQKCEYVEIYLDRETNQIGFKGCKDSLTGFKLMTDSKSLTKRISHQGLGKIVAHRRYDARFEEGFWVIKVPEIAKKDE